MGRKKKYVPNSVLPVWVIERIARCVIDDIRADYASEEVQRDFAKWLSAREMQAGIKQSDLESIERCRRTGKIDSF